MYYVFVPFYLCPDLIMIGSPSYYIHIHNQFLLIDVNGEGCGGIHSSHLFHYHYSVCSHMIGPHQSLTLIAMSVWTHNPGIARVADGHSFISPQHQGMKSGSYWPPIAIACLSCRADWVCVCECSRWTCWFHHTITKKAAPIATGKHASSIEVVAVHQPPVLARFSYLERQF